MYKSRVEKAAYSAAQLTARPATSSPRSVSPSGSQLSPGSSHGTPGKAIRSRIGVEQGGRDGLLLVPASYTPDRPSPLLVMLHGASASGANCESVFDRKELEAGRVLVCLPDSRGRTWDMIRGDFGPDVQYINRALEHIFQQYNVDPNKIACAGFSDGASYALSIGLPNGSARATAPSQQAVDAQDGLFTHIMALSPGYMMPPTVSKQLPKVYIFHGLYDEVLPIRCSRRIVPQLGQFGFPSQLITYHEFEGPHVIPPSIASEALRWFLE